MSSQKTDKNTIKILLACTGSVASIKLIELVEQFKAVIKNVSVYADLF